MVRTKAIPIPEKKQAENAKTILPSEGQMIRSKPPASKKKIVDYYDKNKAQRLGTVISEDRTHITVKSWYGEVERVDRKLVIQERIIDK